jgi:hypothetical protein
MKNEKESKAVAKFNFSSRLQNLSVNKEGHAAYATSGKELLVTQVLTSFFNEPKFYGDNSLMDAVESVLAADAAFVAKLACYARRVFHMRSVSHALTAALAHSVNGKPYIRKTVPHAVVRADDMTEILAAYISMYGRPVPNGLKKGLADALHKFDEYALAKYKGERNALKLRDLLRICHPTPETAEESALWKRVINNGLATPLTWETELSARGNNAESWEKLIGSGSVGYMALLRNLRNIIAAAPPNIDKVFDIIANPEQVRKSRQLPFRFLSAYKELQYVTESTSKVFDALEAAVEASVENIAPIPGKTCVVVDVSGSMRFPVSERNRISCAEIGLMLGLLAARVCEESMFLTFDTSLHKIPVSKNAGILSEMNNIPVQGGGTDMELPFRYLTDNKIKTDRILIFSDNEVNQGASDKPVQALADRYRSKVSPDCWVHAVDLQGYGTQQFAGRRTNIIAGWSEKILEFIMLAEEGSGTLVKRIDEYEISRVKQD